MLNGSLAVNVNFLSRICITSDISGPSLKGFRLFSIANEALAYIFLILTSVFFSVVTYILPSTTTNFFVLHACQLSCKNFASCCG